MTIFSYFIQARLAVASLTVSLAVTAPAVAQQFSASGSSTISYTQPITPVVSAPDYAATNTNPLFPGGYKALYAYLDEHIIYPAQARSAGLEGTARVRFRVQPTGELTHIRVVQSVSPLLDEAALKLVKAMPSWFPAHHNGDAVLSVIELPIVFRLD